MNNFIQNENSQIENMMSVLSTPKEIEGLSGREDFLVNSRRLNISRPVYDWANNPDERDPVQEAKEWEDYELSFGHDNRNEN